MLKSTEKPVITQIEKCTFVQVEISHRFIPIKNETGMIKMTLKHTV